MNSLNVNFHVIPPGLLQLSRWYFSAVNNPTNRRVLCVDPVTSVYSWVIGDALERPRIFHKLGPSFPLNSPLLDDCTYIFFLEVKVLNQICSRPTMSLEAKATKLYEARFKIQVELEKAQKEIEESVQKKDRRVKVERLVNTCEEQLTNSGCLQKR